MSNSYKDILTRLLAKVDDTLDKRQGSIIYDALAPAALELADCYASLEIFQEQTYLKTATGENLDNRVADYGLTREEATYAIRIVNVYNNDDELYDIEIGSQFSIPEEYGGYNYTTTEQISTGKYKATCQTAGSVGNEYTGVLLPLYNINGLGKAEIVGTFEAGEDIEDDETLRARAITYLNKDSFGGNQADYRRYLDNIDGIGGVKIFPIWNGGGTVKISFINSDNTIPSAEFIDEVQTLIDPIANQGKGVGLAPIGHTVTVVAPSLLSINITAKVSIEDEYTLEQLEYEIKSNIIAYIEEIQSKWESSNNLTIYVAKIIATILSVTGISNATNVTINGSSSDLSLTETSSTQQFPIIGTISISEV